MVHMMTMYLSVRQQQRLQLEHSHTRFAALVVSGTDTSVCCVKYVRSVTVSDIFLALYLSNTLDRNSVVGAATRYGLNGPRIESRCGRDFSHPSRPALGPTQPPVRWVRVPFPRDKVGGAWS